VGRDHPRFHEVNFGKNLDLVHRIEAIAKEKHCTPAQLGLDWLLAQGADDAGRRLSKDPFSRVVVEASMAGGP
jgi:hypothetical protein